MSLHLIYLFKYIHDQAAVSTVGCIRHLMIADKTSTKPPLFYFIGLLDFVISIYIFILKKWRSGGVGVVFIVHRIFLSGSCQGAVREL